MQILNEMAHLVVSSSIVAQVLEGRVKVLAYNDLTFLHRSSILVFTQVQAFVIEYRKCCMYIFIISMHQSDVFGI